ncbi:deoxyribodipyrimidine photo-lyase type I [Crenobacter luteus]|uniref:cryptochrome/photolyase family protein n=1 Tax=Crenobacter luteus TaxID=1452487 RepID=UPI00104B5A4F|nr:deoxyribodipyrimidine photo-lyase [Crenobacter luteus]TCP11843.1 deoxyribodipyrimidine photo-lyase type I [Crenobacter luteus]
MPDVSHALCWFRRDLRDFDHAALFHALKQSRRVTPVFVFDRALLEPLPRDDRRVAFIWQALAELKASLRTAGSDLLVRVGDPAEAIPALARELGAGAVFANRDYEPQAIARDAAVGRTLAEQGVAWHDCKDQVIFERDEVLSGAGRPYTVFTPYRKAWRQRLDAFQLKSYPVDRYRERLARFTAGPLPTLAELGFDAVDLAALGVRCGMSGGAALFADFIARVGHYKAWRDFPAVKGVSYLSAHLRFGTVSIRELARFAHEEGSEGAEVWLDELIWREFYQQLLWHFPHVAHSSFKPDYARLPFPNDEAWFAAWCEGRTGYPLVDAAMRQLNRTGYMHNRLRMVAASFLVKDLLIDWRRGERYFAEKLLDFELASNNGGWQWAASTGCDAQPWFRIFNPVTQSQKFDPQGRFIRRYVPELAALDDAAIHAPWQAKRLPAGFALGRDYPAPIVEHAVQREKALALFGRRGGAAAGADR